MKEEFEVLTDINQSLINETTLLSPRNPFYTNNYIKYRLAMGFTLWLLMYSNNSKTKIFCPAFMKTGHLRRSLEIPSIPDISVNALFWSGLINFCRKKGVSDLTVNSFCSQSGKIPYLENEIYRKSRWEYFLDLTHPDVFMKMRKGHNYSIKQAKKSGVKIRRTHDKEAVITHANLISSSMKRRQNRGENVTTSAPINDILQIVTTGTGEIFQALIADKVVSSNLILLSEKIGYNHTQGTSPEGMNCGAAPFLIYEIANILLKEEKEIFNLGGTDDPNPESGLVKFKTGFGKSTKKIELEVAKFKPQNIFFSKLLRLIPTK